jgi:hypothetical protein
MLPLHISLRKSKVIEFYEKEVFKQRITCNLLVPEVNISAPIEKRMAQA